MVRRTAKTLATAAAVASTPVQAQAYIAAPTGQTMVSEMEVGSVPERTMSSTGPARESLEKSVLVQVTDQPMDDDYLSMMAFMNEMVEVRIGVTTDPNAENIFELNINGKLELFRRGETKTVPRYFVDRLLRMKQTRFTQKEVFTAEGIKDIVQVPHTSIKYDFAITRDLNPLGPSWQRAVLAELG